MSNINKTIDKIKKHWQVLFTNEMHKTMNNFRALKEIRWSEVPILMMWGSTDGYCLKQGMIYAKPIWNMHPYEDKCHTCPLHETNMCRFMKVVK